MANYGGYEIVKELSRSPLGLRAVVRAPGKGGQQHLLRVCFLDPIAERGQERYIVESFLEQVRVEQQAASEHWLEIETVGETDEGAFAVSEWFPRTALSLIEGKSRLDAASLKQVMLGVVGGLIALRDQCEGRSHGAVRPEFVLIDDAGGPGRWRVAMSEPAALARSTDDKQRAREADLRAIAAIAIGLVEHRMPRSLNMQATVTEAWQRVAGSKATAWVRVVNRLLDPDLDVRGTTLESVRDDFAALVAKPSASKGKLIATAAVVGLIVIGGGGFAGWKLMGGQTQQVELPPVATDFTPEVWEEWVRADEWMRGLDTRLRGLKSDQTIDQTLLDELIRVCPNAGDFAAWSPRGVVPSFPLPRAILMLEGEQKDAYFAEAAAYRGKGKSALERANLAVPVARRIVSTIQASPAAQHYATLIAMLDEAGATGPFRDQLVAARDALATIQVGSQDDIERAVRLASGGSAAEQVSVQIRALSGHLRDVNAHFERPEMAGHTDPVLSLVEGVLHTHIHGQHAEDLAASLVNAAARGREAVSEAQSVLAVLRSAEFAKVDLPTFRVAIVNKGLHVEVSLDSIRRWRTLAGDPSLHRLDAASDPLGAWRSGRSDAALAEIDRRVTDFASLEGDVEEADRTRLAERTAAYRVSREQIAQRVEAALQLPAIESSRATLVDQRQTLDAEIAELDKAAADLYSELTVSADGLIAEIQGSQSTPVWALFDERRSQLARAMEGSVRSAGDDRKSLMGLRRLWRAQLAHLVALDRHFDVPVDTAVPAGSELVPAGLAEAFMAARVAEATRVLDAVAWDQAMSLSEPAGQNETLASLAGSIRAAMDAVIGVERDLNAWRPLAQVGQLDAVLAWQAAGHEEVSAAFGRFVDPLRARVVSARAVASGDAVALLAASASDATKPELRMASYLAADAGGGSAAIEQDVTARDALLTDVRASADAAWRADLEAQVLEASRRRWAAAMDRAASASELAAVSLLRDRVGADEASLSARSRRHLLLIELDQAVRGIDRSDRDAADASAVRAVQAWVSRARASGLVSGDASWLSELEGALAETARGGSEFNAAAYGPGTKDMSLDAAKSDLENFTRLTYSIDGRSAGAITLVRVREEPFGDDVWFMAEQELSVAQFAAIARVGRRENSWTDDDQGSGPSAWKNDRGIIPRDDWVEVLSPVFRAKALFMPALEGEGTFIGARSMSPQGRMPLQQINDEIVTQAAADVGLSLPPLDVWLAAVESERSRSGLGGGGFGASWVSSMNLNVRDEMWKNQRDHEKSVGRGESEMTLWRAGGFAFDIAKVDNIWDGVNDGYLLFRYVDDGGMSTGGQFRHLIGNVAEIVTMGGQWAVVGGSAMSAPDLDPLTPQPLAGNRLDPFADVGVRFAMSVPADNLRSTIVRRVERVLARAPYQWEP
jgi:hypothetical protein